jgi:hypothetical protein
MHLPSLLGYLRGSNKCPKRESSNEQKSADLRKSAGTKDTKSCRGPAVQYAYSKNVIFTTL